MNSFYEIIFLFRDISLLGKVFIHFMPSEGRLTTIALGATSVGHYIFKLTVTYNEKSVSLRTFCPRAAYDHWSYRQFSQSLVHEKIENTNMYSLFVLCPYGFVATRCTGQINLQERISGYDNIGQASWFLSIATARILLLMPKSCLRISDGAHNFGSQYWLNKHPHQCFDILIFGTPFSFDWRIHV